MSSLQSTPVLIKVPKQADCDMCGLSKILLFSVLYGWQFSTVETGLLLLYIYFCAVLAAAYLKYCWCRLQCLPFVWHFFFLCETHTHTHTHAHTHSLPNEKCNFGGRSLSADLLPHLFQYGGSVLLYAGLL